MEEEKIELSEQLIKELFSLITLKYGGSAIIKSILSSCICCNPKIASSL